MLWEETQLGESGQRDNLLDLSAGPADAWIALNRIHMYRGSCFKNRFFIFIGNGKGLRILWWFSGRFPAEKRRSNPALTEPPPYDGGDNDKGKTYETKN